MLISMRSINKFQSTLPAGGATIEELRPAWVVGISIHAPRGGSDHALWILFTPAAQISIHAPRGGSDMVAVQCIGRMTHDFNPRSPRGERLGHLVTLGLIQKISIHAPRGGSDGVYRWSVNHRCRYFNPRSPRGERRLFFPRATTSCFISIHAPRGGSDTDVGGQLNPTWVISIHAPRGGSDLLECKKYAHQSGFQSTLPAGGATIQQPQPEGRIHNFNPRSPRGERQQRLPKACGKLVQVPVNVKGTVR